MNKKFQPLPPPAPALKLRALLIVCALAVVSQLYLPLPILHQVARDYGLDPAAAAGVMSAFGFAYATGFLIFGPLSDRLGRRKVMLWGLAALTLITGTLAIAGSAPLLLTGRTLQGLAAAAFPPVVIAYLAERGTPQQRTWSVAWLSTAFLSAGLLGQIYGSAVGGRWGLGMALLPLAVIYACTAWALHVTPAKATPTPAPVRAWLDSYRPLGGLLANAQLRRVYVPALLLLMCFVTFYMVLDADAGPVLQAHGITPLVMRGVALPAFLTPLMVAAVIPRYGAERLTIAGLSIAAIGLALSACAGVEHPLSLLATSVIFVAGVGISVPSLIARVANVADAAARGLAVAFYTFVLFVGASLGPSLAQYTARWPMPLTLSLLATLLGAAALYAFTGRHIAALPARQA